MTKCRSFFKITSAFLAVIFAALVFFVPSNASEPPETAGVGGIALYNIENDLRMYSQNAEQTFYPASTVKLMTAALALEKLGTNPSVQITVTAEMLSGASGNSIRLEEGEIITLGDLFAALIINGANDAAQVLAVSAYGSIDAFVDAMNDKAKELGMKDTYYRNPTGLHDSAMFTTVSDTLKAAKYAALTEGFTTYSSQGYYKLEKTNLSSARTIYNKNSFLTGYYTTDYKRENVIGMNAGSTSASGDCVVALGQRDSSLSFIAVALAGQRGEEGEMYAYKATSDLLDWAFDDWKYVTLLEKTKIICELPVTLSNKTDHVTLLPEDTVTVFLPADTDVSAEVKTDWTLNAESLSAPVYQGQVVGEITVRHNGELIRTMPLVTKNNVERSNWLYLLEKLKDFTKTSVFFIIVAAVILVSVVYIYANSIWMKKKKDEARRRAVEQRRRNSLK